MNVKLALNQLYFNKKKNFKNVYQISSPPQLWKWNHSHFPVTVQPLYLCAPLIPPGPLKDYTPVVPNILHISSSQRVICQPLATAETPNLFFPISPHPSIH